MKECKYCIETGGLEAALNGGVYASQGHLCKLKRINSSIQIEISGTLFSLGLHRLVVNDKCPMARLYDRWNECPYYRSKPEKSASKNSKVHSL